MFCISYGYYVLNFKISAALPVNLKPQCVPCTHIELWSTICRLKGACAEFHVADLWPQNGGYNKLVKIRFAEHTNRN